MAKIKNNNKKKKIENENKNEKKTTVTNHESLLVDGILKKQGLVGGFDGVCGGLNDGLGRWFFV